MSNEVKGCGVPGCLNVGGPGHRIHRGYQGVIRTPHEPRAFRMRDGGLLIVPKDATLRLVGPEPPTLDVDGLSANEWADRFRRVAAQYTHAAEAIEKVVDEMVESAKRKGGQ